MIKDFCLLTLKDYLALSSSLFIFLSIIFALVSNYLNGKVMGEAALGVAVVAGEPDSPIMIRKKKLRAWSDRTFYFGIVFSILGLGTQVIAILLK
jgi:hypothetical protein